MSALGHAECMTWMMGGNLPFLRDRKWRAETLLRSWRRSLEGSFLPSSLLRSFSSSSISSSFFLLRDPFVRGGSADAPSSLIGLADDAE